MLKKVFQPCELTLKWYKDFAPQIEKDYRHNMDENLSRFKETTFTFQDFLHHVLWTYDHGIMDHHWAPQTCLCDPCKQNYDFILRFESIGEEAKHVFERLGVGSYEQVRSFETSHLDHEDTRYFDAITDETMKRIFILYWTDFDLYGYMA